MIINTKNFLKKALIGLVIFYCLFYDFFIRLQIKIFGGIKINYIHFRTILFVEVLYLLLLSVRGKVEARFYRVIFPLLISTVFTAIPGIIEFHSIFVSFGIFTNSVLFIFIIYSLEFDKNRIDLKPFILVIIFYGLINAVFRILQYLTGRLIVPELYLNGNSIYKSFFYYGEMVKSCVLFLSALGVGVLLGNCRRQATGIPTDNIYMEYLSSFGIIGMIFFLSLVMHILEKVRINIDSKSDLFSSFIASIFNLPNTFFMIYMQCFLQLRMMIGGNDS